ncbi:hypothetical protein [Rudaea cellulosilytica]|uniref:hypothetical protein n=1 Tax=Rudaea cellulosilytica TaxID=540746 RepID=UPI0003680495|nr:hypothetical protein [Rudaea cellulosilytica]
MRIATLSIFVLAVLSVSCSRGTPPPAPAAQPKPTERQKTVIDAQLKALDKAKAVQGTLDQQKKDMDKKLEDAGG